MGFCSLCNKEYAPEVKECLLSHCAACGSTRIDIEKTNTFNPLSIIFVTSFLAMMIISVLTDKFQNLYFLVPAMSVFMGFSFRDATITNNAYFCHDCQRKGSAPLTKIPLQSLRVERVLHSAPYIIGQGNIGKVTGNNKIFSARNILMILGLIIAIIGMVFGDLISRSIRAYFG